MNIQKRPLFYFMIAYIVGILSAVRLGVHLPLIAIIAVCLSAAAFFIPIKPRMRFLISILMVVFLLGFVRSSLGMRVPPNDVSLYAKGQNVTITGVIASEPEVVNDKTKFTVKALRVRTYTGEFTTSGRIAVSVYKSTEKSRLETMPSYGDGISIRGRLRRPSSPSNPGAFDYKQYLVRQRVFCTMSTGTGMVSVLQPADRTPKWLAARFKAKLESQAKSLFPEVNAVLLLGILLGGYTSLDPNIQSLFMKAGVMHLLAASGYNCGILAGISIYLLRRMTAPRAFMYWVVIALLWGFTMLAGAGPSIVRAAVMMTAFLSAYLLKRAPDMINIVFFSSLVILGFNPLALYDVGFQLSFAAVLGIVLALPIMQHRLDGLFTIDRRQSGKAVKYTLWAAKSIVGAVVLSVVASVATGPITAYYFNYLSLVSVVANAFTALLVMLITATGISVLALGAIWPALGKLAAPLVTIVTGCMLGVVSELGSLSWASLSVRSPSPILLISYYLTLLGVLEYAYRKIPLESKPESADTAGDLSSRNLVASSTPAPPGDVSR